MDACAVNLMRPAMYGAYHHITVMGKEDAPCDHVYDVTGSLCENNDKFAIDRAASEDRHGRLSWSSMIQEPTVLPWVITTTASLKSAEILLKEDGTAKLIRRAETPKDYFATFDCFPIYDKIFE